MYVKVTGDGESLQYAIKLFNRRVKQAGILQEVYDRREYIKPSEQKKIKKDAAIRRRVREQKKEEKRNKYYKF
jgi:ribosomal protein S21